MINRFLIFILFIFPASIMAQENTAADKEMRAALEKIIAESDIPGISIAIAGPDGLKWSGTAGLSNMEERQPVSQGHLFAIGDLSSHFIMAVALQLIEEGMLDPNETPASILADNSLNDITNADKATILDLISHRSAIRSYDQNNDWQRRARGIQLNPSYRWEKQEALKYVKGNRFITTNAPGRDFEYSKSNATILGLVIEKVTGGLLEDEIRNRILIPHKLISTYLDGREIAPKGKLVGSYQLGTNEFISKVGINAKFEFVDDSILINTSGTSLSSEGAAGSILTTPRDLALFENALRNAGIISEEFLELISPEQTFHSEVLGFTTDVVWLKLGNLTVVSSVNLGAVNSGETATREYLNTYMKKIILPVARKYAK